MGRPIRLLAVTRSRRLSGGGAFKFDIDTLKRMGAMPVFYIPQPINEEGEGVTSLGSTLVVQSTDAMILAMRFAGITQVLAEAPDVKEGRFDCTFGFQNLKTFSLDVTEARKTLDALSYAITSAGNARTQPDRASQLLLSGR